MSRKRVLCFGDSNTWGYDPRSLGRYPEDVRWTGRMATALGPAYQVIEEGVNGRTTIYDYKDRFGKNGREYLRPCMDSHFPLDVMFLWLGTNDTKVEFAQSAEQIAAGMEDCVAIALGKQIDRPSPNLKLVVVAPPIVDERHLGSYDKLVGAEPKTRALPALFRAIADRHHSRFFDLTTLVAPSAVDGCHLDPDAHAAIAVAFTAIVRELAPG
ncbi:MAG TPA: SGNH/GDSL hydrolase family protein [Kofleriaceae bacterium]|nr:SGNH/GDSL hydrolase family protein [Kofleriaceae bacterium]